MLTGIPMPGRLVTLAQAPRRLGQPAGDVLLAALAHHVRAQLEAARQALYREVARLEDAPQPFEMTVEVAEARDVLGGPVEDVLVVVAAPRHPRLPVALLLVGELGRVAP